MMNNQLREVRVAAGYSQLKLSIPAHVSPVMIISIEKYDYLLGAVVRAKLAMALKATELTIWPEIGKAGSDEKTD